MKNQIYLFKYNVDFWDETSSEMQLNETGITSGKSLADVVKTLSTYYGEDNVEKLTVSYLTDCNVITTEDLLEELKQKNNKALEYSSAFLFS